MCKFLKKKQEKSKFKVITEDEIRNAYNHQQCVGWTFDKEREVTQTTFNNRFNFLLLVYSLFVNAYFLSNDTNNDRLTILFLGLIIVSLLSLGSFRAYTRFKILFNILLCFDKRNALSIVMKEYDKKFKFGIISVNAIFGWIVPLIMVLSFAVGIAFNLYNLFCK